MNDNICQTCKYPRIWKWKCKHCGSLTKCVCIKCGVTSSCQWRIENKLIFCNACSLKKKRMAIKEKKQFDLNKKSESYKMNLNYVLN